MSFGLGINGALEGASKGTAIGSAIPGIGTTVGGIVGGGLGLLGGLFGGGSSRKDQERLMEKAWEYEKEGMGMQYNYGQAADSHQRYGQSKRVQAIGLHEERKEPRAQKGDGRTNRKR